MSRCRFLHEVQRQAPCGSWSLLSLKSRGQLPQGACLCTPRFDLELRPGLMARRGRKAKTELLGHTMAHIGTPDSAAASLKPQVVDGRSRSSGPRARRRLKSKVRVQRTSSENWAECMAQCWPTCRLPPLKLRCLLLKASHTWRQLLPLQRDARCEV